MIPCVVAVDVGTGSVRAGLFSADGRMLGRTEHPITLSRPAPDQGEYRSREIWAAVCRAVRDVVSEGGAAPGAVAGIGFDATCSLVVRDVDGEPLSISESGDNRLDTIAWLDHRAQDEADACNATGHAALRSVGGVMSPEMQPPKLLWLRRRFPDRWRRAGYFFDLADFLTWQATGSVARSRCTLGCKWTYQTSGTEGWRPDFFDQIGAPDLLARGSLPDRAAPVGSAVGTLTETAAAELGLTTACRVAAGMIDAHAGTLGALAGPLSKELELSRRAALIAGTSTCVMILSQTPRVFRGGWGPQFGVVVPGLWTNEGGQSTSGALFDHLIRWHSAGGAPSAELHARIIARIEALRAEDEAFAAGLHVLPDFHGNRTPFADPSTRGMVLGLTLDASFDGLCRLYWRACVAIALGIRQILEEMAREGPPVDTLYVGGGHARNPLLAQLYADATGCTVMDFGAADVVLSGAAISAAAGSGLFADLRTAAGAMQAASAERAADPARATALDRDYRVFQEMQHVRAGLERLLQEAAGA